jgi:hypothetical protein
MRKSLLLPSLLALASCVSQYRMGREDYFEGMRELPRDPAAAREIFAEADEHFKTAFASGKLSVRQRVAASTYRIRALIELDRHAEARELSSAPIDGFDPTQAIEGDPVGLLLLRAHLLDPEHAFAELLVADRRAGTIQTRRHVAWEMVHALEKMGKPESKAEAIKICQQNPGQIDFDEMKKRLSTN